MRPLRPFPFPLNVGTDICQISRIYAIINGPRGERFVNRILSPAERAQGQDRLLLRGSLPRANLGRDILELPRPWDHHEIAQRDPELWRTAVFLAGRFAAKEAAIKAHSHRRLTFHDVILERRPGLGEDRLGSGPPVARIQAGDDAKEDTSALISISHDGDYATAVCMAADPSLNES